MDAYLEHQTLKIKQIVGDYQSGKIVIPEFQRDYVWNRGKAPKLIDSLFSNFPISSLLLWQGTDDVRTRRRSPRTAKAGLLSWLVDGQQRVITLARTKAGDEGIDVLYNPRDNEFKLANAALRRDSQWFRLSEIWDDRSYRQIRRNLKDSAQGDKLEERFDRVRRILDYEIPIVRMVGYSFDDAITAFRRINTLGVRLKQEDILSAKIAAKHTGFIADKVSPFLEKIKNDGFDRLTVMHLFRACAFVARPDGRDKTPLHEMRKREILDAWNRTERATGEAISLVRGELGLVNMDVLWSGALIVPVIALCATIPPRQRDARGIVGWLALATLLHRYSGASETALDQDLRACRSNDPLGSLLSNLRQRRPRLRARPTDFAGGLADRGGLLAAYIACLQEGILDFYTGGKIVLQKSIDRHHILPRAQFAEKLRSSSDRIANIAFITGGVNQAISATGPEVYLKQLSVRIRRSQCIPTDSHLWRIEKANDFWNARCKLLADSFNRFLKMTLSKRKM